MGVEALPPYIKLEHIVKTFPNVKAIDDCSIEIKKGEIFSLIGENGAGKSTMMKILYGMYQPDGGTIELDGKPLEDLTPQKAIGLGIGMVHQEFMLVKEFTVLENIILGFEPKKTMGRIDFAKARARIGQYIQDYNLDVQPDKLVSNISVGEAQRVEIIKTLYRGANILILDEPTAVLTPSETEKLFDILRSMRDDGKTIVFISHKLGEVLAISDRISVMRRGKHIATVERGEATAADLARLMVGRDVAVSAMPPRCETGPVVLEVRNLEVIGQRWLSTIKGISFDLRAGEILGVAGVDGNGQSELIDAIAGLRPVFSGSIRISGQDVTGKTPHEIRKAGLAHIPEDRNTRGLNKEFTINENLTATSLDRICRGGVVDRKRMAESGRALIEKYDIRPDNGEVKAGSLSGGNAQKIVVAREIEYGGKLLIAAQPTRGVDIGAIESIRGYLNGAKARGVAVLLISADLDEIMALSDRIIVLHEGRISGELPGGDVDLDRLGLMMTGGGAHEAKV